MKIPGFISLRKMDDGNAIRKKIVLNNATIMEARRICMTVLFVPPFCLPTWVMIVMIYLAAFGFDSLL